VHRVLLSKIQLTPVAIKTLITLSRGCVADTAPSFHALSRQRQAPAARVGSTGPVA